jgi:hypothetical protein
MNAGDANSIKYHVVWDSADNTGADRSIRRFDISIDRHVDRNDIEELVCRFVRNEKLETYKRLSLYFYYNFDKFVPDIEDPIQRQKNVEHYLGSYTWGEYWAKRKGGGTIYIVKDKAGKELPRPQTFPYNHLKVCR